jgi:uncharacterized protein (DUF427 family)
MESVWDYPRPPRLEETSKHIVVRFTGAVIVDTRRALRVLETSHPPVYYLPIDDVAAGALVRVQGSSFCEWKGVAFASRSIRGRWTRASSTTRSSRLSPAISTAAGSRRI